MNRDAELALRFRQGTLVITVLVTTVLVTTVVFLTLVVISSCGTRSDRGRDDALKNPGIQPTITQNEAMRRADEYVQRSLKALPTQAQLEKQSSDITSCDDPSDNGPKGRVIASNSYWIRGLPKESNQKYFDDLLHYWKSNGFSVLDDARPEDYFISVEHNSDGFRMSLEAGRTGAINIGASSPCVWPDGTPPPSVAPGG